MIDNTQSTQPDNTFSNGLSYFIKGFKFLSKPGIRMFLIIPLLINSLLFIGGTVLAISLLGGWIEQFMALLPAWLQILETVIWLVVGLLILLIFFFGFSLVANLIASPFNGLLAEQVEYIKTGETMPDTSIKQLIAIIPRSLLRELKKIQWYLPWLLALVILSFIPLLNTVSGILWFVFSAWVMLLQYTDYCSDNHQQSFPELRAELKQHRWAGFGFGVIVAALTTIPLLNLFVMPAAVCGGTLFYLDYCKQEQ